jgi:glycosyltransferase involved in cell wall biosynthesis/GT2 family glycosyltransferase
MTNASNLSELRQSVCAWLESFPAQEPLIAVPAYNAADDVLECVHSLLATISAATPILILDDASPDPRVAELLEPLTRHANLAYVRLPVNGGFSRTLNCAFEWGTPHDVVIVNSDVIVPEGWLERLQAAAYAQTNIATATPLTNHGTLLSVPYRNQPTPDLVEGLTLAEADERVRRSALRLYPVIPTAVGHLIYFKRAALDTVGLFNADVFSPGYGEEVDLSQRMVIAGFCHVAADDVFVLHKGSRSFGQESEARQKLQAAHDAVINERYPWYLKWAKDAMQSQDSPLALAIERARGALLGYDIAIDATCLNGTTTGTQVGTLELVRALASAPNRLGRLILLVGDGVPPAYLRGTDQFVDKVVSLGQLRDVAEPSFDLIHRPFQVVSASDLQMLRTVARRFIVSHLDCISYSNPSYALNAEVWRDYRSQTEATFAAADGIAFISEQARQDAAHKGLRLPPERSQVVHFGVDHQLHQAPAPQPPATRLPQQGAPFLLVMGTNFKHKNRVYAIRLFQMLAGRYAWPGRLIMAGPHVASGGSEHEEAEARTRRPELDERIHDLGGVTEAEKAWLLMNATVVLYPSLYEGFGLIPFEAAAYQTPTLTFRETAMGEVLGDEITYLTSHDPEQGAACVWRFMNDPEAIQRQLESIRARACIFTWDNVARSAWDLYGQISRLPPRVSETYELQHSVHAKHDMKSAARNWGQRLRHGMSILRTYGWKALRKEIKQYIRWRRAQF